MWIEKIELTNFKSYQYQRFEFPKPEQGRNLVLIGGMNGFGKTTLLDALYLCLYGEEATLHLARAVKFHHVVPFHPKPYTG
jgi:DNA sulfur modification protein DndD